MTFRIGQMVEVVNNDGLAAEMGATAVVTRANYSYGRSELIGVAWKTNFNGQMKGGYYIHYFRPMSRKGQQLLFSFME